MRIRWSSVWSLFLILALSLPAIIYGQQDRDRSSKQSADGATAPTTGARRTARRNAASSASTVTVERDVAEALTIIQDNYIDGPKMDYNAVFKSSITGMLRSLDPHSDYFDAAEYEAFRTEQRSEYFGIGATIGDLTEGDRTETYIRATFENAPAHRAGLRFGDHIVEVDGKSMRGKPYPEVRQHLLGPRGSTVKVTVERGAAKRLETVQITRDAVPQPSIPEVYMVRPGVGYVAMTGGFNLTTADEFEAALEQLQSQGMKMLVLDLRGNRGGLLIQAVRVANTFLQRGQLIVAQKGRIEGSSERYEAINNTPNTTPLVVLVDRSSASAAEIVAGALQDHDRALIVGETTFGKGLVQLPFQVGHGSALLLTIAKYYTPSGRTIQRDYENAGFYDYYTRGGSLNSNTQTAPPRPAGPESRTDTGRTVYGGGGITPDEAITPRTVTPAQQRLVDPVFAFALELTNGRVPGFDLYQVQRPINFNHDLRPVDYPMTDALFKAFKDFVARKPAYKLTAAQLDRDRAYAELRLRYELATAAYGAITALQVFNTDDPQIARAIDLLPRARELALAAQRIRNPS